METARTRTPSISRSVAPKFSPLNQHPVSPAAESDKAHPIFPEHPFEGLSPTLAGYPRVVEALQTRRASVHPHVSETMQKALDHRADFFDDFSSESEWEDRMSRTIQSPTASSGPGLRDIPYDIDGDIGSIQRGRNRQRSTITPLPRLSNALADSSGSGSDCSGTSDEQVSVRGTNHARKMSLTRLDKNNVRLVDYTSIRSSIDSPRLSLRSNMSLPNSPLITSANPTPFSTSASIEDTLAALPQSPTFRSHHRRTASSNSTSDSVLADSIINAHVMTMCALEALSSDPRSIDSRSSDMSNAAGRTYLHSASSTSWPKSTSFSANRHVILSPLSTGTDQDDRASRHHTAQIYSPAIKSPNPFSVPNTATTNPDLLFPKASYIPQKHGRILDSHLSALNLSLSNRTTEDYTRLNSSCTSAFPFGEEPKSPYDDRKGKEVLGLMTGNGDEVDMRSRRERNESAQGVVRSSAEERGHGGDRGGVSMEEGVIRKERTVDFDDESFAFGLRVANRELAGNWFRRTFSARTLSCIHIERTSMRYHGSGKADDNRYIHPALHSPQNSQSTTPSHDLLSLYKTPQSGRKNYTWVAWARRNTPRSTTPLTSFSHPHTRLSPSTPPPTIHLTYTLSRPRVLLVMGILLLLSILAAAAWILIGAGEGKLERKEFSQRVGCGMAIAGFVLAVEAWGFGVWVAFS
ncbi:hypothetical protein BKA58DRAFT_367466 [Alternaria rosae]|uniref:uncharacterized protein n=1 Tax=Alternaria rosae TaxID=1187941 RepID=UPI001E8CE7D3|nr:uncharacterized protein BKA58DRAFT_367466 [Alternaria rosae]KAH6865301.1 hypothetical protein BKA58DRAFT_367466 [Alternaria rosae]